MKTQVDIGTTDVLNVVRELREKRFTGYLALCIKGQKGLEEATLLFDNGKVIGSGYEYYAYSKELFGEKAFQRFLNATAAKNGTLDAFETTLEQLHLVLAFHDEAVFVPQDQHLNRVKVPEFSPLLELEVQKEAPQKTPEDLRKKYKLQAATQEEAPVTLPRHEEGKTA